MDPIASALGDLELRSVFYSASDLSAPWGIDIPAIPGTVLFHLLTEGEAVVRVEGEDVALRAGQLLLVPHGTGHTIASDSGAAAAPLFDLPRVEVSDRFERMSVHGGGAPATLGCGAVFFTDAAVARLMRSLPPYLLAGDSDWLRATIDVVREESAAERPGAEVVTVRLAEVLVVYAIRSWLESQTPTRGWVAALRDPYVGRALAAVHDDPGRPWTLPALAAEAAMSRSAFAARFTDLVGETPMAYVTSWRMDVAGRLVREGGLTLAAVAERVGYRSEAAFNRAFRAAHGMPPGRFRREPVRLPVIEDLVPA